MRPAPSRGCRLLVYYHLPPLHPPLLGEAEATHERVTFPLPSRAIVYVFPFDEVDWTE